MIGKSPPRLEAADKAAGRARYVDDVRLPGMLHAAILTSPHAHARILGYRLEAAAGTLAARLRVTLATGRTHQIRVHLGTLGLGIIGDPIYRPRRRLSPSPALKEHLAGFGRMALHARILGFEHPATGAGLRFEQPAPPTFDRLFECLKAELADPADSRLVNHNGGKLGA